MTEEGLPPAGTFSKGSRFSREHWFVVLCAFLAPLGMATMAVFFEPDERGYGTHEQLGISACTLLEIYGVPCPGCGVTTSVTLASQGRLADSFFTQPLGLFIAATSILFSLWSVWNWFRGRDVYQALLRLPLRKFGFVAISVALVSWIYKWIIT